MHHKFYLFIIVLLLPVCIFGQNKLGYYLDNNNLDNINVREIRKISFYNNLDSYYSPFFVIIHNEIYSSVELSEKVSLRFKIIPLTEPEDTTGTVIESPLGISDVSVYPNPVDEKVTITAAAAITQVVLFDMQGRQLFELFPDKQTYIMNVDFLSPGLYYLQVRSKQGVAVKKIVKL